MMSGEKDKENSTNRPSFDDEEDNNPFPHMKGLASLMSEHLVSNGNNSHGKDVYEGGVENSIDEDESVLLYNSSNNQTDSKLGTNKDAFKPIQINYESRVTRLLRSNSNVEMQITKAGNSNEGMINTSKTYIVYSIQLINKDDPSDEIQTRRRYSEFESLRDVLTKIFPLIIIPPIPPKNYFKFSMLNDLVSGVQSNDSHDAGNASPSNANSSTNGMGPTQANYSYINSTHLHKNKLIEHRKRLLSNFLNNCLSIPQIRNLEFFAKFLDPNANWSDEITLITSQLPKSIYLSNPENGLKTDSIYTNLPNPISNHALNMAFWKPLQENKKKLTKKTNKILNNGNTDSTSASNSNNSSASPVSCTPENLKNKYIIDTSYLDEINKKIMANFIGLANDYTELGTIFNSFSLILSDSPTFRSGRAKNDEEEEDSKLNIIFDKIGQIFDRSYITISTLIADLETKFSEPLGEAVQYSTILQFIDKFQKRKIKQKQLLDEELKDKNHDLEELLKAEDESSRIENVVISKDPKFDLSNATPTQQQNNDTSLSKSPNPKFKYFPNMNSFKKITQYVTDIIDQNPEQTRKQKITTLQEKIVILEKCQGIMLENISYITDEVNKNFRQFHNKQLKIIYEILLCYNGFLIGWAKKNVDIWEEIKDEVEKL